jgi:hypothetical protein
LAQSYQRLAVNGRIALTDIVVERWQAYFVNAALRLMPGSNAISRLEYLRQLHDIGFTDVVIEDVSDNVFQPFTSFLRQKGGGWAVFGAFIAFFARCGARFVIIRATKSAVQSAAS